MNTDQLHPFLARMVDGETGTQTKILQTVVSTLQELEVVFRSNAKELFQLVRATDFLNEKAEKATSESRQAIENLSLRLSDVNQSVVDVRNSVEDVKKSIEKNSAQLSTLQRALSDFPAMVKELKKMLGSLDLRLKEPVTVKVDFAAPASAQEGAELTSTWNTLIVDVVQRNFAGNIETVRIRKES